MIMEHPVTLQNKTLMFFVLVFGLSVPFWVAGLLTSRQLLPALPVSALGFLCPVTAAAILVYRANGPAGVVALLKRSFDYTRVRSRAWFVPTLLLMPGIMVTSYGVMRLTGVQVPILQFSVLSALVLFCAFFIGALGEELGWSGYATDPLQDRLSALGASLLIGAVWSVWHWLPLLEADRSLAFIAWWSLDTVALRVTIVWLYNNSGKSVFVAALFHALVNLTWQLFPVNGSYYDPRVTGLITAGVALLIVVLWGPRRLSQNRFA